MSIVTSTAAAGCAAIGLIWAEGGSAHADDADYLFQTPSGNIGCELHSTHTGGAFVYCVAHDHTWGSPLPPSYCPGGHSPETLVLNQGEPPGVTCHAAPPARQLPTLDFDEKLSIAAITCVSGLRGVTCADAGTGHFFRLSRESYEMG